MSHYLGVDGGQSTTKALIADESGRVIGDGASGPCNHVSDGEGRDKFLRALGGCVEEACIKAGLHADTIRFAAACLGFSGGAPDKNDYSRQLIRADRYKITHDAEIALSGAAKGAPGIIVIAGTGSMAFGRNHATHEARAGGWGYIFGDEGGGFDLARQALRAALQFEEGWGPSTELRDLLLEATGLVSANQVMHRFYTAEFSRSQIAGFAKLVTKAAECGDQLAVGILAKAASELARLAEAVFGQLFSPGDRIPVAHVGGVFQSTPVRDRFTTLVHERIDCLAGPPALSPVAGAVLEALRIDGNLSDLSDVPESGE